jgi:hypothetical protein
MSVAEGTSNFQIRDCLLVNNVYGIQWGGANPSANTRVVGCVVPKSVTQGISFLYPSATTVIDSAVCLGYGATSTGIFQPVSGAKWSVLTDGGLISNQNANFATIDLGNTDTTLARSAAGVVTVEGVPLVTTTGTQSLTNKTLDSPAATGTTRVAQSGAFELYNTADQTTNFEKLRAAWLSDIATISTENGGTGTGRMLRLQGNGRRLDIGASGTSGFIQSGIGTSGANAIGFNLNNGSWNASTGVNPIVAITPAFTQTGTAGYTALLINPTETGTGSGTKRLIDAQVGGSSKFSVDNAGLVSSTTGFFQQPTVTVNSATTITLTANSPETQIFTGTPGGAGAVVVLPTTSILAGRKFVVINPSNASVQVQSSDLSFVTNVTTWGGQTTFIALQDNPTTAAHWAQGQVSNYYFRTTPVASSTAQRDGNGNLFADNFIETATSTATAAGTTTLDINSTSTQVFTGSTTQTVRLPTTSVIAGQQYTIINQSSGAVTVQSSDTSTVSTVAAGAATIFLALAATPTTAAHWRAI